LVFLRFHGKQGLGIYNLIEKSSQIVVNAKFCICVQTKDHE
jgi:hypothetical protein